MTYIHFMFQVLCVDMTMELPYRKDVFTLSNALRAMKGKTSSHEAMTEVAQFAFNVGYRIKW